jgi:DNA helicase TIP49 (TBP-interacting protein)
MRKSIGCRLGQYTAVKQGEVRAVKAYSAENINKGYESTAIYILSDSQAAIKALEK